MSNQSNGSRVKTGNSSATRLVDNFGLASVLRCLGFFVICAKTYYESKL